MSYNNGYNYAYLANAGQIYCYNCRSLDATFEQIPITEIITNKTLYCVNCGRTVKYVEREL